MTTVYEVTLEARPQQFFIALAGTSYSMLVRWCSPAVCWVLDLVQGDGTPVLLSVPLVTGHDLLEQHAHLGIGGALIVQSDGDLGRVPQFDELGASGHLYFLVP